MQIKEDSIFRFILIRANSKLSNNWNQFYPRMTNLKSISPREMIKTAWSRTLAAACLYLDYCFERGKAAGKADFDSDFLFMLFDKVIYLLFQLENGHDLLIAYGPTLEKAAYQKISNAKKDQADRFPDEPVWSMEHFQLFRESGMDVKITAELVCQDLEALISALKTNQ